MVRSIKTHSYKQFFSTTPNNQYIENQMIELIDQILHQKQLCTCSLYTSALEIQNLRTIYKVCKSLNSTKEIQKLIQKRAING